MIPGGFVHCCVYVCVYDMQKCTYEPEQLLAKVAIENVFTDVYPYYI